MSNMLLGIAIALLAADTILLLVLLLRRQNQLAQQLVDQLAGVEKTSQRIEQAVRQEVALNREEAGKSARALREEVSGSVRSLTESIGTTMSQMGQMQKAQFDTFCAQLTTLTETNERKLEVMRQTVEQKLTRMQLDAQQTAGQGREELARSLSGFGESVQNRMTEIATLQKQQLDTFAGILANLTQTNEQKLEQMRQTVEAKLAALQQDNAQKLEQMRATVDEKLHTTLEQRLSESFKLVSERLEQVHNGLGEMRTLAAGVGDLKKVLTNIKTRGCWGEVQLGHLLEEMLTREQYEVNVAVNPRSAERVEYAVKLPGRDATGKPVWLPIDAKFPQEDYQRLIDAQEQADAAGVESAAAALEVRVRQEARKIKDKYICPPDTTDFAILFLATESLFAEALRRPGLCEAIMNDCRVVIAGPTTLAAVLSSLRMGFRTLAIEKRSSEVWATLGAVKMEFSKFGDSLEKVQKKLQEASNSIDSAKTRSRMLEGKLRKVEELPVDQAPGLLGRLDGAELLDGQADLVGEQRA